MKKLRRSLGKWIRKKLWPNWTYKGELLNSDGKIVMMFHDKDFPEFQKAIMMAARVDLTDTSVPRKYLYTQHQLVHDHVFQHIKLSSGKQVEVRLSVISKIGGNINEIDQLELLDFIKTIDWSTIVQTTKPKDASYVVQGPNVMREFEAKRKDYRTQASQDAAITSGVKEIMDRKAKQYEDNLKAIKDLEHEDPK